MGEMMLTYCFFLAAMRSDANGNLGYGQKKIEEDFMIIQ
jgi:hypothetical protein